MKPKHLKLIRILAEQTAPTTAGSLASIMEVSIRSVKTYVQEINSSYPGAVHSSRQGYSIDANIAQTMMNNTNTHIPQSSKERCVYILNNLFKNNIGSNAYDLCDEMFISYSTLKNELQIVKRKLAKFDLQLINNSDILSVVGLEKNKRKLLSSILYEESNVNFVSLKVIQDNFLEVDSEFIKECLLETFDKYHYFVNDYSLINLVVHITIAVDRIQNNIINTPIETDLTYVRSDDFSLAREIADKIEQYFNITYSDDEIYELALLLISRGTAIDYKTINLTNLNSFIGEDCFNLVTELIQSINSFYYIDLTEPEFLIRFALHIRNLLLRSKNNYFSKNPLTEEIKASCPLIYDASVCLSGIIKDKTGITINDDEIAYIAFHLGSTLEAQKNLNAKITAVLYCPNYYDMNSRLIDTINQHFSSDILVTDILTDESEFDKYPKTNLIISTMPVRYFTSTPLIQIGVFMTEKDIHTLRKAVETIKINKKRNTFKEYLEYLIIPEFFVKRSDLLNERDVIDYMTDKMYQLGYVNESFKDDIYAREQMSSTAFHDFAIPHAMKMRANKTGINILISEKPISWNQNNVYLVMMLCFNSNERHIFNEIYDPLTMIISEREQLKKILQAENYKEFIDLLTSFIVIP